MTPSTEKFKDKPLSLSWIGLIYKHYQLCDVTGGSDVVCVAE